MSNEMAARHAICEALKHHKPVTVARAMKLDSGSLLRIALGIKVRKGTMVLAIQNIDNLRTLGGDS